jgi:hypothetical protein
MTDRRQFTAWIVSRGVVAGILASIVATSAPAADPGSWWSLVTHSDGVAGLYLNLDLGAAKYPSDIDVTAVPGISVRSVDSHTVIPAGALDFGWRLTPNFSAETGFADLGRTSAALANRGQVSVSVRGPTVAFIGSLPFDNWESYLKVGYLYSAAGVSIDGFPASASGTSLDTFDPFVAAGLLCAFDDHWYTRLEFEHYQGVGYVIANATESININVATVGVGFRF